MGNAAQALAFFAGANSFFYGACRYTTDNAHAGSDRQLLARLGRQGATDERAGQV
jgi:biotin synthase